MKRHLLPLLLLAGLATLPAHRAQAQEKPVLNSAPPGPPPAQPRPVEPAPAPSPAPAPATTPTTEPTAPTPAPEFPAAQPSPDSPSGLELPGREAERKAAQEKAEKNTRLFIYSGFGLGYSSYAGYSQFNGSISPALGIRLTERLSVGPGISYTYNNYGFGNSAGNTVANISTTSIGVKVFGQLRVIDQFMVHAEFENIRAQLLNIDAQGYVNGTVTRTVQAPLAGIGYRQQFSNRAAADILLLYNFQDDYNSIYSNPVIRFNFLFNIGK